MTARKGLILAGGAGQRLYPATLAVSKQLMPVYDKPMIYYPLTVLMQAGIREIAVIVTPRDRPAFEHLLGDGSDWGLALSYIEQPSPDGLAQAYLLAEGFLDGAPSALVLGDNLFFGEGLADLLGAAAAQEAGGTVFGYHVADPGRYGVIALDGGGTVTGLVEKPVTPPSNYALTGLYFLDSTAPERARGIVPSARGELEIVSLLETYLADGALTVKVMGRGVAWLDTGTFESLLEAGTFVRAISKRQGQQIGCPEEVAFARGWIDIAALRRAAARHGRSSYGAYLQGLADSQG